MNCLVTLLWSYVCLIVIGRTKYAEACSPRNGDATDISQYHVSQTNASCKLLALLIKASVTRISVP